MNKYKMYETASMRALEEFARENERLAPGRQVLNSELNYYEYAILTGPSSRVSTLSLATEYYVSFICTFLTELIGEKIDYKIFEDTYSELLKNKPGVTNVFDYYMKQRYEMTKRDYSVFNDFSKEELDTFLKDELSTYKDIVFDSSQLYYETIYAILSTFVLYKKVEELNEESLGKINRLIEKLNRMEMTRNAIISTYEFTGDYKVDLDRLNRIAETIFEIIDYDTSLLLADIIKDRKLKNGDDK